MIDIGDHLRCSIVGLRVRLSIVRSDAEGEKIIDVDLTLAESEALQRNLGKLHAQIRSAKSKDPSGA